MNIITKLVYGIPLKLWRTPCGTLLVWSVGINLVLFSLLVLSIVRYPDDGADVPAKAEHLYELERNMQ